MSLTRQTSHSQSQAANDRPSIPIPGRGDFWDIQLSANCAFRLKLPLSGKYKPPQNPTPSSDKYIIGSWQSLDIPKNCSCKKKKSRRSLKVLQKFRASSGNLVPRRSSSLPRGQIPRENIFNGYQWKIFLFNWIPFIFVVFFLERQVFPHTNLYIFNLTRGCRWSWSWLFSCRKVNGTRLFENGKLPWATEHLKK